MDARLTGEGDFVREREEFEVSIRPVGGVGGGVAVERRQRDVPRYSDVSVDVSCRFARTKAPKLFSPPFPTVVISLMCASAQVRY